MTKKKKGQKANHPWRVWVPKKDKQPEQSKYEKIPINLRMGVRL